MYETHFLVQEGGAPININIINAQDNKLEIFIEDEDKKKFYLVPLSVVNATSDLKKIVAANESFIKTNSIKTNLWSREEIISS